MLTDFDEDGQLALIQAYLAYKNSDNWKGWYWHLRNWCGYRTGSPIKQRLEQEIEEWLQQHPTWVRLNSGS